MSIPSQILLSSASPRWMLLAFSAGLLGACGGGGDGVESQSLAEPQATTTFEMQLPELPDAAAVQLAQPTFHIAPLQLDEPGDEDASDNTASARLAPRVQSIPADTAGLPTQRLTLQAVQARRLRAIEGATPQASSGTVTTYTPAQIRAAYGLPSLPATGVTPTAMQAAQMGAGQTIYIVDAMHDPNAASELAAFNQKFGLPACTSRAVTGLPLAAPSAGSCDFVVAYTTTSGALTSSPPAYDSGWATEIALDVQWAHATAPLARIVLIEAPDASINSLLGAIQLANAMGPGVVSMSFGAGEGSWTASVDSVFGASGMSYAAATGDYGVGVMWPSASGKVLAVGGTSLTYTGGSRSEVVWSSTGGGVSQYVATPSYQNNTVPGMGSPGTRNVGDVAFNADPYTGQYVAIMSAGTSTASWISAGGTSLSTPQWAGLVAIANATRALNGLAELGQMHAGLYEMSTVPGNYAAAFADITSGANGSCASCGARTGYDPATGLGTPNVSSLVTQLQGDGSTSATAPVVSAAAVSGTAGTPLNFTVSVSAAHPVSYSLSGAPSGMSVSAGGIVSWASPVAGTYAVTAVVVDNTTGLKGQGVYTVTIQAAQPVAGAPLVTGATITGKPATALSFKATVTAAHPVSYAIAGAPSGMTISTTGVVSWARPVVGSYSVTVTATDKTTRLSGSGVYSVQITPTGPVITAAAITGRAGRTVTGRITISDPGATAISVSIAGAPAGASFVVSGTTVTMTWRSAVLGSYSMTVSAQDNFGLSASKTVPVTITR